MKILFLDIDGVVNCKTTSQRHRGFIGIDPYLAFMVGKIQLDTGCEIVLSSTWRLDEKSRAEVRKQVGKFIDCTPSIREKRERGWEIQAWLDKHPDVTKYAILDDDSDMLEHQLPNFFKTSWEHGITPAIAEAVTRHLGPVLEGVGTYATSTKESDVLTLADLQKLQETMKNHQPPTDHIKEIATAEGVDLAKLLHIKPKVPIAPVEGAMAQLWGLPVIEDEKLAPGIIEVRWSNGYVYKIKVKPSL